MDRWRGRGKGYVFIHAGDVVGTLGGRGYWIVEVEYEAAMVHRVIWEMHNAPLEQDDIVDHENGDKGCNKINNLVLKTHTGNARNHKMPFTNTSGVCGVMERTDQSGYTRFIAQWRCPILGVNKSKSFNTNKYGYKQAFRLAQEYRAKMLEELNNQGAGYTSRHGLKETQHDIHPY